MKRLIFDLDNTICHTENGDYANAIPRFEVIEKLIEYKKAGFEIVISTSRNMRTFNNNIGKISANTLPLILNWLKENNVPFDEIYVGKPWCGTEGFYIDDRSIRPREFRFLSYKEIVELIKRDEK
jgi:capsule biosynthesis phosphatase